MSKEKKKDKIGNKNQLNEEQKAVIGFGILATLLGAPKKGGEHFETVFKAVIALAQAGHEIHLFKLAGYDSKSIESMLKIRMTSLKKEWKALTETQQNEILTLKDHEEGIGKPIDVLLCAVRPSVWANEEEGHQVQARVAPEDKLFTKFLKTATKHPEDIKKWLLENLGEEHIIKKNQPSHTPAHDDFEPEANDLI